jgi:hypothetical protein
MANAVKQDEKRDEHGDDGDGGKPQSGAAVVVGCG